MKKLFVSLLIMGAAISASAQVQFGVKGGFNLSNMLEKDNDETYSDDYKMNPGFHFGVTADMPINDFLSFESGLILNTKGVKIEEKIAGINVEGKLNLYYLDIPLTIKTSHDLGNDFKLFALAGPYIGLGLSGNLKGYSSGIEVVDINGIEVDGIEVSTKQSIKWGSDEDEDHLKRLDYGLTFGAGAEIKSFMVGISYDLGLANIVSDQEYGYKMSNRVLRFSVGYRFGKL